MFFSDLLTQRPDELDELLDVVGQIGLFDPFAVVLGVFGLVIAELLADRRHLLTEQELTLRLLHAVGDVFADAVLEGEVRQ